MRIIDGHCHVGVGRYKQQEPEELIARMDRCGIEQAVVCPVEEYIAVNNEDGNAYILDVCKKFQGRFIGFAVANPWYGPRGADQLRTALDRGLRGVKMDSSLQGFLLNDEIVYPLVRIADEYGVPMYFHTGTPAFALPLQLRDLAKCFPKVNFIMGHALANDFGGDVFSAVRGLRNIYLDTSHNLTVSNRDAIAQVGADRMIFGSNAPRSEPEFELKRLRAATDDEWALEKICFGNILSLLGDKP